MDRLLGFLPDPGTLDLILLGLFVGPIVVLGIPVLRAVIKVPRRMQITQLSDAFNPVAPML